METTAMMASFLANPSEVIRKILVEHVNSHCKNPKASLDNVNSESLLGAEPLGLDSLDRIEIILNIEFTLGRVSIDISDGELSALITVGELAEAIKNNIINIK